MPHTHRAAPRRSSRLLALALVVAVGLVALPTSGASADTAVPFSDPNAHGVIGLCDRNGQPIDHGRTTDRPFVWAALASSAAPADYAVDGRTATLFGFQPRKGLDPGQWSGQLLTASSRYDNPAHPKAQATEGDDTLADFLGAYPARWDGLVQLRMYLGAPGVSPLTQTYAATDIRVSGDTWTVVHGGPVDCNATQATSIEAIYLTPSTTSPGAATPTADPTNGVVDSVSASPASGAAPVAGATPVGAAEPSVDRTSTSTDPTTSTVSTNDGGTDPAPFLFVGLIVAGAAAALLWFRRRGRGAASDPGLDTADQSGDVAPDTDPADDPEGRRVAADSLR